MEEKTIAEINFNKVINQIGEPHQYNVPPNLNNQHLNYILQLMSKYQKANKNLQTLATTAQNPQQGIQLENSVIKFKNGTFLSPQTQIL